MRGLHSRLSLIAFVLLAASQSFAIQLFSWQPSEGSVPVVLARQDGQSAMDAAKNYLEAFNANPDLVALSEAPLEIPLAGFKDLVGSLSGKPTILVLANEPQQFRGGKNGKSWYRQLSDLGADVYVLPVVHDVALTPEAADEFRDQLRLRFDGMLALGGADVDPSLYGEPNRHAESPLLMRDVSEMKVIKTFLQSGTNACFGICRGSQLTAVLLGYKLHEDIALETTNGHYHVANDHPIAWLKVDDSVLKRALEKFDSDFPSQHHQAVIPESNPNGPLKFVAAHEPGGDRTPIAEAFELKNGIGFMTQWHPERDHTEKGATVMGLMVQETKRAKVLREGGPQVGRCTVVIENLK